jgi:hypothetical protein
MSTACRLKKITNLLAFVLFSIVILPISPSPALAEKQTSTSIQWVGRPEESPWGDLQINAIVQGAWVDGFAVFDNFDYARTGAIIDIRRERFLLQGIILGGYCKFQLFERDYRNTEWMPTDKWTLDGRCDNHGFVGQVMDGDHGSLAGHALVLRPPKGQQSEQPTLNDRVDLRTSAMMPRYNRAPGVKELCGIPVNLQSIVRGLRFNGDDDGVNKERKIYDSLIDSLNRHPDQWKSNPIRLYWELISSGAVRSIPRIKNVIAQQRHILWSGVGDPYDKYVSRRLDCAEAVVGLFWLDERDAWPTLERYFEYEYAKSMREFHDNYGNQQFDLEHDLFGLQDIGVVLASKYLRDKNYLRATDIIEKIALKDGNRIYTRHPGLIAIIADMMLENPSVLIAGKQRYFSGVHANYSRGHSDGINLQWEDRPRSVGWAADLLEEIDPVRSAIIRLGDTNENQIKHGERFLYNFLEYTKSNKFSGFSKNRLYQSDVKYADSVYEYYTGKRWQRRPSQSVGILELIFGAIQVCADMGGCSDTSSSRRYGGSTSGDFDRMQQRLECERSMMGGDITEMSVSLTFGGSC